MRILRVAQKVYPDVKGGGPYHVHAMSRDQAAMGHDVTVVTVRQDDSLPHVEGRDGYTVVRYDPAVNLLGNDISPGIAQYLADAKDFDVMHAHSHLYFSTNLAALKRFLGDIPLAITNHGLYSQNAPEWVFDLYLRSLGRWTFDQADVVFCYTETDKERVREFGVSSRIEVVPNGIDTERFSPEGPESDLVDADGPVVLFVGRLVEGKRPRDAIAALERVRGECPEATLYFCGDGPLRSDLEDEVIRRGLEDAIEFVGHVPYEDVPTIYRSADVLVLPSRAEGLPRTVLESMASATPVVVSDLPQVAPIATEGGEAVSVGAVDEFANEIGRLIRDRHTRRELGEHGRDVVGSTHDWQDTVDRTTAALTELPTGTSKK
ncbi:glycosyltransferase family 4 protein [Halobiforma nitratireducens]|uniref:Group 1 glycosyl transferase n=1 Tax=Halobiforma nitratireducens JCM 10879 TaxID=1227454 RepID=M0MQU3_9EURY|nr:glycosyltransferase family 4 protein [Halobiforma nitratireducens]EMA47109.1 group 1 glycosyl transferase [Halobiforma nitratireducens JCM 10879]